MMKQKENKYLIKLLLKNNKTLTRETSNPHLAISLVKIFTQDPSVQEVKIVKRKE